MSETHHGMSFCRVRFLLEATAPAQLRAHQAATVYALLAAAYGCAAGEEPAVPEGVMPDAPEQCRLRLMPGDSYAMGCTVLQDEPGYAARVTRLLETGLRRVGSDRARRRPGVALAGNFRLRETRDLVSGRVLGPSDALEPLASERVEEEKLHARSLSRLTLIFGSPLRMARPAAARIEGHTWLDEQYFDAGLFAVRVMNRLASLGLASKPDEVGWIYHACRLVESRLVWLDLGYGPESRRKVLGGSVGRVTVACGDDAVADALVMGQYVRVGQSTRFGFGSYRILELGPAPDECARSRPLLETILSGQDLSRLSEELDLPSGLLRLAVKSVIMGSHEPQPYTRVPIEQPGGKRRVLSIPAPLDRALQRAVHERLAPALDHFFEESSLAYRHGLGRHRAAERVRTAFRQGYRFALKSDFRSFFDSISHQLLEDRLHAYLSDPGAVRVLMTWVRAGAPSESHGIPTGSPLSPLLGNLFLDSFDEETARDGGRLVRYADDFLILFRNREQAQRVYEEAADAASALLLTLNDSKTKTLDLLAPFQFLGFQFCRGERWDMTPSDEPRPVEDLGWRQAARRPDAPAMAPLPGESEVATAETRSWVVFGPGASVLRVRDGRLSCSYADARGETSVELDQVREVLVLGGATVTNQALKELASRDIRMILADDSGRPLGELATHGVDAEPDAIRGQLQAAQDGAWRLGLSRRLVAAKIANYAALAHAVAGPGIPGVAPELRRLHDRALGADSIASLLGIEGVAALRWYSCFAARVPHWCGFQRRVAPHAEDPANILLNLAHTALHRQVLLAVRLAGLLPASGILHEPRPGHAALASDLQEPFRHLMDRAVLALLPTLKQSDFQPVQGGPYNVSIRPDAARRVVAHIHSVFVQPSAAAGKPETFMYLTHLMLSARQLRRHLVDRSVVFEPFVHPSDAAPASAAPGVGAPPAPISPANTRAPIGSPDYHRDRVV